MLDSYKEYSSPEVVMDPLLISVAFILGFLVRQVGLPPLVGFLAAGFVLNGLGFEGGETLQTFADLGVTLLLFSIGLKLDLKSLAKPEVWAGASLHMAITVAVFSAGVFGLGLAGIAVLCRPDFSPGDPGCLCSELFQYRLRRQNSRREGRDGCDARAGVHRYPDHAGYLRGPVPDFLPRQTALAMGAPGAVGALGAEADPLSLDGS